MLKHIILIVISLAFCWQAQTTHAASISTSVDRANISMDETVVLSIRVSPQASSTPSFAELESQFDILNRSQNSQYRNINGRIEAFTEWQLTLAPKAAGKLLIPSIQYDQEFSDAIVLNVSKAKESNSGLAPDIFLDIQAENSEPYVQQQVIVTVKLHTAVPLRVDEAPALNIPNTLLIPLKDSQYQKRIGDKVYSVSELRYALFPQMSGPLEIPIQTFTVTSRATAGFNNPQNYGRTETKRVRSQPITLAVKPQAENYQGKHWLPASQLTLTEAWSTDVREWTVGEPITRTITLEATGLSANQVPSLSIADNQNYKQYREKPEPTDKQDARGLSTSIIESVAIVPTHEGVTELPEVKVNWWDTSTNSAKVAILPARKITIKANPNLPALAPSVVAEDTLVAPEMKTTPVTLDPHQKNDALIWQAISALLLLTSIFLCALLIKEKRARTTNTQQDNRSLPQKSTVDLALTQFFTGALNKQNAARFLALLNLQLPKKSIAALSNQDLATKLNKEIQHLAAYTYGEDQNFNGDLDALETLIHQALTLEAAAQPKAKTLLSDLYPA